MPTVHRLFPPLVSLYVPAAVSGWSGMQCNWSETDPGPRLAALPLPKLCPVGFVFIWAEKEHIGAVINQVTLFCNLVHRSFTRFCWSLSLPCPALPIPPPPPCPLETLLSPVPCLKPRACQLQTNVKYAGVKDGGIHFYLVRQTEGIIMVAIMRAAEHQMQAEGRHHQAALTHLAAT